MKYPVLFRSIKRLQDCWKLELITDEGGEKPDTFLAPVPEDERFDNAPAGQNHSDSS